MGRKAFITGIEGFTGRYMAAELRAQGYEVYGLVHQASAESGLFQGDLADSDALKQILGQVKPDVVIHLAALAFVGHGNPGEFYQVNLMGTRNLLEAIADCESAPESVLLASSANVYGNASEGMLSENSPEAAANDYAVSKLAMEYMAKTWMGKLPITIARPFNYTGVGQTENFLLPKIVSHFNRSADRIELGNLDVWRDFSDVRSVVSAYRGLIETPSAGQTFNVASGETYSLREVLALCSEITGHKIQVDVNPAFVRANEVKTLCGDASRLRLLLGDWKTRPLKDTLNWMLSQD